MAKPGEATTDPDDGADVRVHRLDEVHHTDFVRRREAASRRRREAEIRFRKANPRPYKKRKKDNSPAAKKARGKARMKKAAPGISALSRKAVKNKPISSYPSETTYDGSPIISVPIGGQPRGK